MCITNVLYQTGQPLVSHLRKSSNPNFRENETMQYIYRSKFYQNSFLYLYWIVFYSIVFQNSFLVQYFRIVFYIYNLFLPLLLCKTLQLFELAPSSLLTQGLHTAPPVNYSELTPNYLLWNQFCIIKFSNLLPSSQFIQTP